MYFFSTINSPERPPCCHAAVFIGSSVRVERIACSWLCRPHCICLEHNTTLQSKTSDFLCCILYNKPTFFWNQSRKSKKLHDVRKSGDISKKSGICRRYVFIKNIIYIKLQDYSIYYQKTKRYMQKIPFLTGIVSAMRQNYNICM